MGIRILNFVIIICAFLFVVYHHAPSLQEKLLLIGILSAPQNFEQREAIRKTWLQNIGSDITYYFLIGKRMCDVPVEDRIDEFSCNELPMFSPADSEDNGSLHSGTFICHDESTDVPIYSGYTFTVQHDIIIHHIGVISAFCENTVHVSLLEAATDFKITSSTFYNDESSNSSNILWKPVESYRLPKGFEGKVIMENTSPSSHWHYKCGFNWNSSGNILAYHLFWSSHGQLVQFHNSSLTPVAINFELPDVDDMKRFILQKNTRKKLWNERISDINQKLKEEASHMGDILFLNVVDTYRSLPKKMLQFYTWADRNVKFSYLLKTDDDTFINILPIHEVLHSLSATEKSLPNRIWWWSDFREGWPVQLVGKWRETAYRSLTYPPFPCGAGYVLSRGVVKFLSSVADKLYTEYQGEDVALGIWLASINPPSRLNKPSCFWTCDASSLAEHSCNYPQLSVQHMMEVHSQVQNVHTML